LAEHISDWCSYLLGKGATQDHVDLSRARVTRLLELDKVDRISGLTPSRIQAALKAVRDSGAALRGGCPDHS
jgi:hypothetical protein